MIEMMFILSITTIVISMLGVFLLLRRLSMLADAISHTIILGIVLAFFIVRKIDSPFLLLGATVFAILTVIFIEFLIKTRKLSADASVGIVFPFLFSLGILLISVYARNVHLDQDVVLVGNLVWSTFNRIDVLGYSIQKDILYMSLFFLLLLLILVLFYKELKLLTFDPQYAVVTGISVAFMHYGLTALTSLASVMAFDALGIVLVVAFMITPPAIAFMYVKSFYAMFLVSGFICIVVSILTVYFGILLDVSISGLGATILGILFLLAVLVKSLTCQRKKSWKHLLFRS